MMPLAKEENVESHIPVMVAEERNKNEDTKNDVRLLSSSSSSSATGYRRRSSAIPLTLYLWGNTLEALLEKTIIGRLQEHDQLNKQLATFTYNETTATDATQLLNVSVQYIKEYLLLHQALISQIKTAKKQLSYDSYPEDCFDLIGSRLIKHYNYKLRLWLDSKLNPLLSHSVIVEKFLSSFVVRHSTRFFLYLTMSGVF